jgi:hypothetical protein
MFAACRPPGMTCTGNVRKLPLAGLLRGTPGEIGEYVHASARGEREERRERREERGEKREKREEIERECGE